MRKSIQNRVSISFPVHDVEPASEPLPERRTVAVLERLLKLENMSPEDQTILSCSDYNSRSVDEVFHNPLFSAVHLAYTGHRSLVLSPDMIWIAVVQGFAQHINNNSEKYRHRFVSQEGKLLVTALLPGLDARSPESDWAGGIEALAREVEAIVGERFGALSCDFTTSGAIERLACQVALLDTFQSYFTLVLLSGCGIPSVTLLGDVIQNPADLSLRPRIGWAVRHAPASARIVSGLREGCRIAPPLEPSALSRRLGTFSRSGFKFQLPADFLTFYKKCDGISLDDLSIRPFEMLEDTSKEEVERMIAGISIETEADSIQVFGPGTWIVFADFDDGRYAVIESGARGETPVYIVSQAGFETAASSMTEFVDRFFRAELE